MCNFRVMSLQIDHFQPQTPQSINHADHWSDWSRKEIVVKVISEINFYYCSLLLNQSSSSSFSFNLKVLFWGQSLVCEDFQGHLAVFALQSLTFRSYLIPDKILADPSQQFVDQYLCLRRCELLVRSFWQNLDWSVCLFYYCESFCIPPHFLQFQFIDLGERNYYLQYWLSKYISHHFLLWRILTDLFGGSVGRIFWI